MAPENTSKTNSSNNLLSLSSPSSVTISISASPKHGKFPNLPFLCLLSFPSSVPSFLHLPCSHSVSTAVAAVKTEPVILFWWDITHLSYNIRFAVLALVVFATYSLFSYIQEYIFFVFEGFIYGWFVSLYVSVIFVVLSSLEHLLESVMPSTSSSSSSASSASLPSSPPSSSFFQRIPIGQYFILAALTAITMGFSNSSLLYLNYPTQVSQPSPSLSLFPLFLLFSLSVLSLSLL
jgi:hypothetical protein